MSSTNNFWLVIVLFKKFDTPSKKINESDKNTNFMMKNNTKMKIKKKKEEDIKYFSFWTRPKFSWCNMLHTLGEQRDRENTTEFWIGVLNKIGVWYSWSLKVKFSKLIFGGFFSIQKKIFEIVFDFVLKFENARL